MYFREEAGQTPNGGTAGRLIYAIGDVHGRYELLKALLAKIIEDCRGELVRRPMLVFCGDYVDRGRQSAEVLEVLVWLKQRPEFEVRTLMGNHEQALLQFLAAPTEAGAWLRFGGGATLSSYGVPVPAEDDAAGLLKARDALAERMPSSHRRVLEGLELMVVVGGYAFVHAGIRPGVRLADQSAEDLLWIRDEFLDAPGPFEKVIVHGHSWSGPAQVLKHRLGLDTGAYATGVLTAARLDNDTVTLLDTAGGLTSATV